MQDNKYLPIVAAILVLAAISAGAYYLLFVRKEAPQAPSTGAMNTLEQALSAQSSGMKPTQAEMDAIQKALSAPAPKGSSASNSADITKALSQPAK